MIDDGRHKVRDCSKLIPLLLLMMMLAALCVGFRPNQRQAISERELVNLEVDGFKIGLKNEDIQPVMKQGFSISSQVFGEIWKKGNTALIFCGGELVGIVGRKLTLRGGTVLSSGDSTTLVNRLLRAMRPSSAPRSRLQLWAVGIDKEALVEWQDSQGRSLPIAIGVTTGLANVSSVQLAKQGIPVTIQWKDWVDLQAWASGQLIGFY